MNKREDVLETSQHGSEKGLKYGLLYSGVFGWLDMGHAKGTDIRVLLSQFSAGEASGKPYYKIHYEQTISVKSFSTGRFNSWRVKKEEHNHK